MVTTFDLETAKELIGTKLAGTISKQECEPYLYKAPNSNEEIELNYTFVYNPEPVNADEAVFA